MLAPPGEMDELRMNQEEMERAADESHGGFYTLADADKLLQDKTCGPTGDGEPVGAGVAVLDLRALRS